MIDRLHSDGVVQWSNTMPLALEEVFLIHKEIDETAPENSLLTKRVSLRLAK
jgi:hypothetical protein